LWFLLRLIVVLLAALRARQMSVAIKENSENKACFCHCIVRARTHNH